MVKMRFFYIFFVINFKKEFDIKYVFLFITLNVKKSFFKFVRFFSYRL